MQSARAVFGYLSLSLEQPVKGVGASVDRLAALTPNSEYVQKLSNSQRLKVGRGPTQKHGKMPKTSKQ